MCYAIPGRVESIDDKIAVVDYFGERKKAINELDGLSPGDYIYAQGGYVIEKIPQREAQEILAVWKETFFELQEADLRLSGLAPKGAAEGRLSAILDKILDGGEPSRDDLIYMMAAEEPAQAELIHKAANYLRRKHHGNACCIHGIIEISNRCSRDCHYCGISASNRGLERYRMTKEEIISSAVEAAAKYNFKALVLQSGENCGYDAGELASMVKEIRSRHPMLIFVSFGEMTKPDLEALYAAGARGLLLRFETSNPALYGNLHPGHNLESRLGVLREARRIGYLIITGGLLGLPGQTDADIADDLLLAKDLGADMFSFGPFLPHPATPLSSFSAPSKEKMLKVLSLARLIDPLKANVVVTTALETLDAGARRDGLMGGANSVMLNLTPLKYRNLYSLYPRRAHEGEEITVQIEETLALLRSIGRAPADLGIYHETN